ncbi:hypothetical protein Tco_1186373 [Tanacetum coccineum]
MVALNATTDCRLLRKKLQICILMDVASYKVNSEVLGQTWGDAWISFGLVSSGDLALSADYGREECKSALKECKSSLEKSNKTRDRYLGALHDKEVELKKYKIFNDRTIEKDTLEQKLNETLRLLAQKELDIKEGLKIKAYEVSVVKEKHDELVKQSLLTKSSYESLVKEKNKVIKDLKLKEEKDLDKLIVVEKQLKFLNEIVYKRNQSIQTIHMLASKGSTYNGRPNFANPMYIKKAQSKNPCLYEILYDKCDLANLFAPDKEETLTLNEHIIHNTRVSRQQLRSTQMKEKVMHNNSQLKFRKTEVEDHHRISSISNKTKSVTACNDNLKSKTSNVNVVYATCGKYVFNSNHDACVSKFINDVNARTKKPKVVPISTRKPKSQVNKSVATPHKKTVASDSKSYYRMLYENTNKVWKWWIKKQCPLGYKWVPKTKMKWVSKVRKEDVNTSISPTIDNTSRITNVLKITNTLGYNLSNVPSSSNYLAYYATHPIHY